MYWCVSVWEMKDRKLIGKIYVVYGLVLQRDFFIELVEWFQFFMSSMDYGMCLVRFWRYFYEYYD